MRHQTNTRPFSSTTRPGDDQGVLLASRVASEMKSRWRQGEPPNVATALREHPELKRYRSIVLDLAYDEYRHRCQAGESLDADEFSRRFPSLQKSLYLLIEIQELLNQDPDFRALQESAQWPEPGESFLGFSMIAELGRGTFGRVYMASEPALGDRVVALKVAPQGGKEAEMLGKLRHPNIVPVHSVREDVTTGYTAVCMPYLGRATLCDVLDEAFADSRIPTRSQVILDVIRALADDSDSSELPSFDRILCRGSYVEGIIHFAVQITDALAYAHSRGICHRDLKPSNVLVSVDGRPLLLDFNLSFDAQVRTVKIGGTLPYMAPEQLELVVLERTDHAPYADPRSDLFSLGVVLYQLLCGSLPFGAISWDRPVNQIAEQLLREQKKGPEPLRDKNQHVDKSLARLIDDCLAFDLDHRPQSADALAAAFRKELTPVRRVKRWVSNHRRRVSLMLSLLLVLALAGGSFVALRDPFSVRQFKRGLAYSQRGEYEPAIEHLDESIRSNPEYAEAFFARGRAHQFRGSFELASQDLYKASKLAPGPEVSAAMGYCLSRLKYYEAAIKCYHDANDKGFESAGLLNNMGFSCIWLERLEEAEEYLRQAIERDGTLQAAHHNLIILLMNRACDGQSIPGSAITDVHKAVTTGRPSADLYRNAAALCALGARDHPEWTRLAMEYLQRAIAHGADPRSLESDPMFLSLHQEPDFDKLMSLPARHDRPTKSDRLVDPL